MGLFDRFTKPKWEHKDQDVRLKAVNEITDEELLYSIAKNDESDDVAELAITKINDKRVLNKLANDYGLEVRCRTARTITDSEILSDMMKNEEDLVVLKNIMNNPNFKDEYLLAEKSEIIESLGRFICEQAIDKINSGPALKQIALNTKCDCSCRTKAVRKIKDEDILVEIICDEKSIGCYVAKVSFEELISQGASQRALIKIAKTGQSYRGDAIKKITSESVLIDLAENEDDKYILESILSNTNLKDETKEKIREKIKNQEYAEETKKPEDTSSKLDDALVKLERDFQRAAYESSSFNHSSEYGPYLKGMVRKSKEMVEECKKLGEYQKAKYYQKQYENYKKRYDDFKLRQRRY